MSLSAIFSIIAGVMLINCILSAISMFILELIEFVTGNDLRNKILGKYMDFVNKAEDYFFLFMFAIIASTQIAFPVLAFTLIKWVYFKITKGVNILQKGK
jgi:hypothetical protein